MSLQLIIANLDFKGIFVGRNTKVQTEKSKRNRRAVLPWYNLYHGCAH
jgi:hypothetical protein